MKGSYKVLENGKIKVRDYDNHGNLTEYEYDFQDNIEQILKEENVKEYLEKELIELEEKVFSNEYAIKRNKNINLTYGLSAIAVTIFFGILSYYLQINSMIGGSWKIITCGSTLIGLTMFTPLIWFSEKCNKKFSNVINGCKIEIEEIKKQLEKTNNNIKKLQNNKFNTKDQEIKYISGDIKVSSTEQLKNLKNYLLNFYSLGLHENELSEYYQQGILDKVLKKEYDEDEIEIIKKHFEEKGPTLVKKREK